jgi:hypothetical protein
MRFSFVQKAIIIQKVFRKYLVWNIYSEIISNLQSNYYLIYGDFNKILKKDCKSLKLIKYDSIQGEDMITTYKFDYIKEIHQFLLFISKSEFHRENTLVHFYLDDQLINNFNFQTIYKTSDKFYNILNLTELKKKQKIYPTNNNKVFYDPESYRRSHKKFMTTISISKIQLNKSNSESKAKKMNSSSNIKEIIQFSPILKSPSQNILNSSKSNRKRVKFSF